MCLHNDLIWQRFPIAPVASIHFFGERVNALRPACILNPSNSVGLKSGLYNCFQMPRYSIVLRLRIQLAITAFRLYHGYSSNEFSFNKKSYIPMVVIPCSSRVIGHSSPRTMIFLKESSTFSNEVRSCLIFSSDSIL